MSEQRISAAAVAADNEKRAKALREDYESLGVRLARSGVSIDAVTEKARKIQAPAPTAVRIENT